MIILKLGGSVITNKAQEYTVAQHDLDRISKEIKAADAKELVIVHGGGSFGHPTAHRYNIHKGYHEDAQLMGFALTQKAMENLNEYVTDSLIREKVPAVQIQPSAFTIMEDGHIKSTDMSVVEKAIEAGIVPVLYGVPAFDLKQGFSILSGDEIIRYLAEKFRPERLVLASDVDGIMTGDPKREKGAKLIPEITVDNFDDVRFGEIEKDVTGGMRRKVKDLLALAEIGVQSQIVNAKVHGNVQKALRGEIVGTVIR